MALRKATTKASALSRMTFGTCVVLLLLLCVVVTLTWTSLLPHSPSNLLLRMSQFKFATNSKSTENSAMLPTPPEQLAEAISLLMENYRKERASIMTTLAATGESNSETLQTTKTLLETQQTLLKRLDDGNREIASEIQLLKAAVGQQKAGEDQRAIMQMEETQNLFKDFVEQVRQQVTTAVNSKEGILNSRVDSDTGAQELASWRQRQFVNHSDVGFVRFSGYRMSSRSFAVVGLSLFALHDQHSLGACRWFGQKAVVSGKLRPVWPNEHHFLRYEAMTIICETVEVADVGGALVYKIGQEDIEVYREQNSSLQLLDPPEELPLFASVCTAPMHGHDFAMFHIREFVEYYKLIGVEHFVLYDAGTANTEFWRIFEPDLKSGVVEVTDFREVLQYESWYYGQLLGIQDCIYRLRFSSKWVLMADIDEYLWVKAPQTLHTFLSWHDDKVGISHGSWWFSTNVCRPLEDHAAELGSQLLQEAPNAAFTCEKFVFRWPEPACFENKEGEGHVDAQMCMNDKGHRKNIVNPRKLERLAVHNGQYPDGPPLAYYHARVDEVGHSHFQYLTGGKGALCNVTAPISSTVNWWKLDITFSQHLQKLRFGYECDMFTSGCKKIQTFYS